jgi:hypothetical protein
MNITVLKKCMLLVGLKNALDCGMISYGTYLSLQTEIIEMRNYE